MEIINKAELTIDGLEKKIGYIFKNKKLLISAITHKSYAYEKQKKSFNDYNERMEFLGDAILEHIVSMALYGYTPLMKEGDMSKKRAQIVCEDSLSSVIEELEIEKYIRLGKCEKVSGGMGKKAIQADMLEAIIGAIYLDSDFETVNKICLNLLEDKIKEAIDDSSDNVDYKTVLQEMVQAKGKSKIEYKTIKEEGKAHKKKFYVQVNINGIKCGEGNGKTKKAAEKESAKAAIQKV